MSSYDFAKQSNTARSRGANSDHCDNLEDAELAQYIHPRWVAKETTWRQHSGDVEDRSHSQKQVQFNNYFIPARRHSHEDQGKYGKTGRMNHKNDSGHQPGTSAYMCSLQKTFSRATTGTSDDLEIPTHIYPNT